MWDPISVFAVCWMLNAGLPDSRLTVEEVLIARERSVLNNSITLRQDYELQN